MGNFGYKKYMKKEARQDSPLFKIFIMSFVGMLLFFTLIMRSFSPSVDTTIGDYQQDNFGDVQEEQKIIDGSLAKIQDEDNGNTFSELMKKADDLAKESIQTEPSQVNIEKTSQNVQVDIPKQEVPDVVYKVFIGTYTSAEQAKVAKEIIQETGNGLSPIVKCLGANNYTLQVGIFKNKQSAETLLYTVQQNNLPGRIVQDY